MEDSLCMHIYNTVNATASLAVEQRLAATSSAYTAKAAATVQHCVTNSLVLCAICC
jgi:hypothetical protein